MKLTNQNKTDLLEIVIAMAMFLLIVVIYVPLAIWAEEDYYEKESRHRMQNLFDLEIFYSQLVGEYNLNFFDMVDLVNATRDSMVADSLFLGSQTIYLNGNEFIVDVPESFGFEYDTTFGIKSFRRDTVLDTTLQIAVYSEDLGRDDTSFIRKVELEDYEAMDHYVGVVNEEPIKRVEAVEYYKTHIPDSTTYFCPLTEKSFEMELADDGTSLKVSSPIKDIIKQSRYFLFSFKAKSHGIIQDGTRSWD